MSHGHRSHDDRLLDALSAIDGVPFDGPMWRVVSTGRSVFDGSRGAGRWNPSDLSVLYGAQEADGAMAEVYFHITLGQPVFPSRIQHDIFELKAETRETLVFANMDDLERLNVDTLRYSDLTYTRTQEIGSAAAFMGFDGIIAPSARWDCQNIVFFLNNIDPDKLTEISQTRINWDDWRARHRTG